MIARPQLYSLIGGVLLGIVGVSLLPESTLFHTPQTASEAMASNTQQRWACPMMCTTASKPGTCPVCGMTMTPITAGELNREQTRRMGLETSMIHKDFAQIQTRAYGKVSYDNRFTQIIIPRVSGRIVERYAATDECCEVIAAGAPIVELYSPEVIAAQGELQSALKLDNPSLLARLRERFSRWNLDEIADAILAGEPIRETVTIRSPFAGQVMLQEFEAVNNTLAVGREIQDDTPLLTLVDPDNLVLVVHIPESRARWIVEGQKVLIESDELGPLPQIQATVSRISREIDPFTRAREVRIYLQEVNDLLFPGALAHVRIENALAPDLTAADPENRASWGQFVLIPKQAVLSTGVRSVAWKVAERMPDGRMRFELAPLALGPRIENSHGNDFYIVRAGLNPGDEVATQGAFLIDSQAQLAGTSSLIYPLGANAAENPHQH